jgi:hypothetical protein
MIDFQKYNSSAARLTEIVHSLWSKVTFITVAEVIQGEVDIRDLDAQCWQLKDQVTNLNRKLQAEMNKFEEDEYFEKYEDLHSQTDYLFHVLDNKLGAIDSIVSSLKEIQDKSYEEDFTKLFSDIDKLYLGESHSPIKLKRFKR